MSTCSKYELTEASGLGLANGCRTTLEVLGTVLTSPQVAFAPLAKHLLQSLLLEGTKRARKFLGFFLRRVWLSHPVFGEAAGPSDRSQALVPYYRQILPIFNVYKDSTTGTGPRALERADLEPSASMVAPAAFAASWWLFGG